MKNFWIAPVALLIVLSLGCKDNSVSPANGPKPGTIQVSVSDVPTFNGHTIWYSIWDSVNTAGPLGTTEGVGYFVVQNGSGNSMTALTNGQGVRTFNAGKYYIYYFADMNDNFTSTNSLPDAGDYAGGGTNYAIIVNGNVVKQLTMADFILLTN
jgi:hypothetical protein